MPIICSMQSCCHSISSQCSVSVAPITHKHVGMCLQAQTNTCTPVISEALIAAALHGNIGCNSAMFPHCTGWLRLPTRPPAPRPPCWKTEPLVHFPSVLPPRLQTTLVPSLPSCTNSVMPPMSLRAQLPSRLLQLMMTLRLTLAALSHRRALRLFRTS